MASLRSYGDPCGIARALDLVGERWSLLIVRELCFGPKRFKELRVGLPEASPNVLSQRLRELEGGGVIRHHEGRATYELTDWGRELHPLLVQLGRWGARSQAKRVGQLSLDALMVALEATFVPAAAKDARGVVQLRLAGEAFRVDLAVGALSIARGDAPNADVFVSGDAPTLRAVVFGDVKLAESKLELSGDLALGRRFLASFRRPTSSG